MKTKDEQAQELEDYIDVWKGRKISGKRERLVDFLISVGYRKPRDVELDKQGLKYILYDRNSYGAKIHELSVDEIIEALCSQKERFLT